MVDDNDAFLGSVITAWKGFLLVFEIFGMYDRIFHKSQREFMPRWNHPPPTDREGILMNFTEERVGRSFMQDLMDIRYSIRNAVAELWALSSEEVKQIMEANSERIKTLQGKLNNRE